MDIGEIRMFAGDFAPMGWALCDGRQLPISENRQIFDKLKTTWGGDGRVTFALPDLRGRAPVHYGNGVALGAKGKITVDAGAGNRYHARTAINFIIALRDGDDYDPLIGEVRIFATNFAPQRWAFCDGRLLSINSNVTLFSLLGNAYGGDSIRSFELPNLKGSYPFQPNETAARGQTAGAQPYEEGTAPSTPLLVVHYCIALEGIYPSRT